MIDISDIKASIQSKALIQDEFFKDAQFLKDSRGRLLSYTGGYTVVIPCIVNGEKWAFRCWHVPVADSKKRYSLISAAIQDAQLPFFCSFEYTEKGLLVKGESIPITKMKWVEGKNLKNYICAHYHEQGKIKDLAQSFVTMITSLHSKRIAHGDLQHGNILVSETGQLYLVDYDSMYVPAMGNSFPDVITGLVDYQHPARKINRYSSEKADYFSELIIYLSLLAISQNPSLVDKYNVRDSESLLFRVSDFGDLHSSEVYRDLWLLSNRVRLLLLVLESYLEEDDINMLQPFTSDLAKSRVEMAYWRRVVVPRREDKHILEEFITFFPSGYYASEATLRLSNIIEAERREEDEDHRYYAQARHSQSPIDYRFYINRFPTGHHIDEAKSWIRAYLERLDDEEWSKAKRINTINSYRQYLESPTNVRYRTEAQRLVDNLEDEDDWSLAVKANTYAAYLAYQRKHPMGNHKADCSAHIAIFEDDVDWLRATRASTLSIYEEYLRKHRNGKHRAEAQERIIELRDDNKWDYAVNFDTVFAYSLYKSDYPKGRHIEECEKRLRYLTEEAMWERCVSSNTIASYQDYLNSYSQGRYIDAARNAIRLIRDDEDWRSTQKEKTIKANRRYLEKYGKSARHAEEARNAISELKFGNYRWILAMSVVIVCFLIAWFVITHIDAMQTTSSAPQHQASGPIVNNTREINRLKMEIEAILKDKEQIVKEGNAPGLLTPVENLINQLEQYQDSDVERYKRRLEQLKNKR